MSKNIIMWDATSFSKVSTHLNFSNISCDFFKEELNIEYGKIDKESAVGLLRDKLVSAARVNKNLVINLDKLLPNFSTYEGLDSNMIFNYEEFHKEENYMKIVSEKGNFDELLNEGKFSVNKDF